MHPGGQRLDGRAAVRASFEQILSSSPGMQFRLSDVSQFYDQNLAVRVLHEHIRLGKDSSFQPPVVATNIYHLTDNGWRMVMHHAVAHAQRRQATLQPALRRPVQAGGAARGG